MNLHKIMIGLGILLIVLIPIWLMFIVPELLKMPKDYGYDIDMFVLNDLYNIDKDEFFGPSNDKLFRKISSNQLKGNKLKLIDFISTSTISGDLIYEKGQEFVVDRSTKIIDGTKAYFEFPKKVKKIDYQTWFYYIPWPFTAFYNKTEDILGLKTYVFSWEVEYDATDGYDGEGVDPLIPEFYNALEHSKGTIWVEPITGIIIKIEGSGIGYYVDKNDDVVKSEKFKPIIKWSEKYRADSITNQVRLAQNEKQRIYLIRYIVPILLGLVGIALIFASFIGRKFMDKEEKLGVKPIFSKKKDEIKKSSEKSKKPLVTFDKKEEK